MGAALLCLAATRWALHPAPHRQLWIPEPLQLTEAVVPEPRC
jgi:hypothetical protein